MSDLMLDVDQAGELKAAFRRGDWTKTEIKRLLGPQGSAVGLAKSRQVLVTDTAGRAILAIRSNRWRRDWCR